MLKQSRRTAYQLRYTCVFNLNVDLKSNPNTAPLGSSSFPRYRMPPTRSSYQIFPVSLLSIPHSSILPSKIARRPMRPNPVCITVSDMAFTREPLSASPKIISSPSSPANPHHHLLPTQPQQHSPHPPTPPPPSSRSAQTSLDRTLPAAHYP